MSLLTVKRTILGLPALRAWFMHQPPIVQVDILTLADQGATKGLIPLMKELASTGTLLTGGADLSERLAARTSPPS